MIQPTVEVAHNSGKKISFIGRGVVGSDVKWTKIHLASANSHVGLISLLPPGESQAVQHCIEETVLEKGCLAKRPDEAPVALSSHC